MGMIKISTNKELDYEVYFDFHDHSRAGTNFGEKIRKDHPNINLENYKKYIDDFYIANQPAILDKQEQINKLLSDKQDKFYSALKDIFGIDFSANVYQGYLSIFDCNPRYLETKTFQIYYKKEPVDMLKVAFHEITHFAFFEYLDKNFSKEIKDLNKNNGILWKLSEVFNVIILNLPPFREIIGKEEKLPYPNLKYKLSEAKRLWGSCSNIGEFIVEYLEKIR